MVEDGELLHRRIVLQEVSADGHISNSAFNDRQKKPSVDRAILRTAQESQRLPSDGIVQLVTKEVREIAIPIDASKKAEKVENHDVDVIERPIRADNPDMEPENLAHAQVEAAPDFLNDSRFRKLKEALARLAERLPLVIAPTEPTQHEPLG